MPRTIYLILALLSVACAPGEIERRLTTQTSMSCPAVLIQRVVCDPARDGIQDCHMETVPVLCEPQNVVATICIPAGKEDAP